MARKPPATAISAFSGRSKGVSTKLKTSKLTTTRRPSTITV
jgi:hypothetical protein